MHKKHKITPRSCCLSAIMLFSPKIIFIILCPYSTVISACYAWILLEVLTYYCIMFIYSKNLKKNMKKNPNFILSYLVKFQKRWDIFQIFVAFSENLNFATISRHSALYRWRFCAIPEIGFLGPRFCATGSPK